MITEQSSSSQIHKDEESKIRVSDHKTKKGVSGSELGFQHPRKRGPKPLLDRYTLVVCKYANKHLSRPVPAGVCKEAIITIGNATTARTGTRTRTRVWSRAMARTRV